MFDFAMQNMRKIRITDHNRDRINELFIAATRTDPIDACHLLITYTTDDINGLYDPSETATTLYQPTLLHVIITAFTAHERYDRLRLMRDRYHMDVITLAMIPFRYSNSHVLTALCSTNVTVDELDMFLTTSNNMTSTHALELPSSLLFTVAANRTPINNGIISRLIFCGCDWMTRNSEHATIHDVIMATIKQSTDVRMMCHAMTMFTELKDSVAVHMAALPSLLWHAFNHGAATTTTGHHHGSSERIITTSSGGIGSDLAMIICQYIHQCVNLQLMKRSRSLPVEDVANGSRWQYALPSALFDMIGSFTYTRDRLLRMEHICRHWYNQSSNGNGWSHNIDLMWLAKPPDAGYLYHRLYLDSSGDLSREEIADRMMNAQRQQRQHQLAMANLVASTNNNTTATTTSSSLSMIVPPRPSIRDAKGIVGPVLVTGHLRSNGVDSWYLYGEPARLWRHTVFVPEGNHHCHNEGCGDHDDNLGRVFTDSVAMMEWANRLVDDPHCDSKEGWHIERLPDGVQGWNGGTLESLLAPSLPPPPPPRRASAPTESSSSDGIEWSTISQQLHGRLASHPRVQSLRVPFTTCHTMMAIQPLGTNGTHDVTCNWHVRKSLSVSSMIWSSVQTLQLMYDRNRINTNHDDTTQCIKVMTHLLPSMTQLTLTTLSTSIPEIAIPLAAHITHITATMTSIAKRSNFVLHHIPAHARLQSLVLASRHYLVIAEPMLLAASSSSSSHHDDNDADGHSASFSSSLTHLTHLHLGGSTLRRSWEYIIRAAGASLLTLLDGYHTSERLAYLYQHAPMLQSLSFHDFGKDNRITHDDVRIIGMMTSLTHLSLHAWPRIKDPMWHQLRALTQLQSLILPHDQFQSEANETTSAPSSVSLVVSPSRASSSGQLFQLFRYLSTAGQLSTIGGCTTVDDWFAAYATLPPPPPPLPSYILPTSSAPPNDEATSTSSLSFAPGGDDEKMALARVRYDHMVLLTCGASCNKPHPIDTMQGNSRTTNRYNTMMSGMHKDDYYHRC